jgi:predicted nucleotidyltransferase
VVENSIKQVKNYIPPSTYQLLDSYREQFGKFHTWEDYFDFLKFRLLTMSPSQLNNIYEVEEGLEYRLLKYIKQAQSFSEYMQLLKTKRYTWTRLQRVCLHILTNTQKEQMNTSNKATYVRLLGMSSTGQQYLKLIKKELELPLVSTLSSFSDKIMELDIKATSTYAMCLPEPIRSNFIKAEFSTPPIKVK